MYFLKIYNISKAESNSNDFLEKTFKIFKVNFCKKQIFKCSKHANIETFKYSKYQAHLKSQKRKWSNEQTAACVKLYSLNIFIT